MENKYRHPRKDRKLEIIDIDSFEKKLEPVAEMILKNENVCVVPINRSKSLQTMTEVVYVWKFNNSGWPKTKGVKTRLNNLKKKKKIPAKGWIRVGVSKKPVMRRLNEYAQHINKRLQEDKGPTKKLEADCWKQLLVGNNKIIAYVYQPSKIKTILGSIKLYLDIERILIQQQSPLLNSR